MENRTDLRAAIDRAKLLIRLSAISAVLSLVLFILVLILGIIKSAFAGSDVFAMAVLPLGLATVFSIAALIYGMLLSAAAVEDEEKYLLARRKENTALNVEEDVRFTAGRTFDNFRRYAPYVFAGLGAFITGGLLWLFYRYWTTRVGGDPVPDNALHSALVSAILMLIAIFAGAFYVGQSRTRSFRWLRPVGSALVTAAGVFLLAMISAVCTHWKIGGVDTRFAWILFWIFAVLGAEYIFNFIIEFYRPRTVVETRPVFESRLLALFTEPGGVMRNLAEALDYQFGFKVSGTGLYRFLERALIPFVLVWMCVLWLSTSIYEVGPDEIGIRERFGKVVSKEPLKSGVYFELPFPFGSVRSFACDRIRQVFVGGKSDADDTGAKRPEVMLWTKKHSEKGENEFVIADENKVSAQDRRGSVSVALVSLDMPVQYRIRKAEIMKYAYGNANPDQALRRIAEEVASEYLASCSMIRLMTVNRQAAGETIRERIQQRADAIGLGIEVINTPVLGLHPPVEKVAPAFQEVIGAMEQMHAKVLEAEAYRTKVVPAAELAAIRIEADAASYRARTAKVAEAEAARFNRQLTSYLAMPQMFMLNSKLALLEEDAAQARKFIVSRSLTNEIYELNFEEKERLDLIDADLGKMTNPQ